MALLGGEGPAEHACQEVEHQHDQDKHERGPQAIGRAISGGSGLRVAVVDEAGSVIIWSLNRLKFVESVDPAMISSGAVSPMTRAMASVMPVMIRPWRSAARS